MLPHLRQHFCFGGAYGSNASDRGTEIISEMLFVLMGLVSFLICMVGVVVGDICRILKLCYLAAELSSLFCKRIMCTELSDTRVFDRDIFTLV